MKEHSPSRDLSDVGDGKLNGDDLDCESWAISVDETSDKKLDELSINLAEIG